MAPKAMACRCFRHRTGGEPVLGVVYDPYADELYSAVKGEGGDER